MLISDYSSPLFNSCYHGCLYLYHCLHQSSIHLRIVIILLKKQLSFLTECEQRKSIIRFTSKTKHKIVHISPESPYFSTEEWLEALMFKLVEIH